MSEVKLKPSDYVHLHNHTQYSLLDGLTKIPALIDQVSNLGMSAIAVTDHGTLSGAIELYKTAKAQDIKPIVGLETYVSPRGHQDKDPVKDKNPYHLTLLAMNDQGYQNLMKLSTLANLIGYYYRPRIDHDLLELNNEGLIVLSGCIGGEIGEYLMQNQYDQAKSIAKWYKKVFGDRYYLEIQDHGHPEHSSVWEEQRLVTDLTLKLAKELNIDCVVTCDAHYLNPHDQEAHEILLCVQTGSFLSDDQRLSLKQFELHLTDPKQVIKRWGKKYPELITNTKKIADRCNVEIQLGRILIPKFKVPPGNTEKSQLRKLVFRGLAWRYGGSSEEQILKMTEDEAKINLNIDIRARAEYELSVINEMGFNGYFLIIADFVNWGKDKGIVFGPGRGSAAGSIISYALKITELDPLKYDLLFERFLNPDRISMPDIDIDMQDTRRDEVIKYCVDKYGENRVANIVTFGRMAARNAVRDVARVLQVPYIEADRLAKMIPPPIQGRHIPLEQSLKDDVNLALEYKDNQTAKQVFDLAMQLEGTIRSHGVHAAGVVIAPDDIVKFAPLEMAQKGVIATQYSMGPIEDIGLLKIDFLGLSNLTIIKNSLRIIKKVYGKDIDITDIPLDDKKTLGLFQRGDTTGVFQFESAGMKRYLKQLKPNEFEDLIAMNALYRPGPMQWIDDFIARKHGQKDIGYIHDAMEPALKNTYGVIVYQEQVMQISKEMCGFSGGQADTLRKAIGKKKPEELAKLKTAFIEGAIKTVSAKREMMEKFWIQLEAFAAYCFPKSHAACYGLIAYQTAYLKAHYPSAFMSALMTSDYDNTDRLAIEIKECEHMGIEVLPPDINESFVEFAVVPDANKIRFGLAAIKNVGTGVVEEILRIREEIGMFDSLEKFFGNVNTKIANRKTIESLIKAGAFDRFGERGLLLDSVDNLLAYASRTQKQNNTGQIDLFGESNDRNEGLEPKLNLTVEAKEINLADQLKWEKELLGVYLSQHPLERFESILAELSNPITEIKLRRDNESAKLGGVVSDSRVITTKNGKKMAFVKIVDRTNEIEVVVFPGIFQQTEEMWQVDKVLLINGKVNRRSSAVGNDEPKLIVDEVQELTLETKAKPAKKETVSKYDKASQRLFLRLKNSEDHQTLTNIKKIVDDFSGNTDVVLVIGENSSKQAIKLPSGVNSSKAISELAELLGDQNVVLK